MILFCYEKSHRPLPLMPFERPGENTPSFHGSPASLESWCCYVRAPVPPLPPFKGQGGSTPVMHHVLASLRLCIYEYYDVISYPRSSYLACLALRLNCSLSIFNGSITIETNSFETSSFETSSFETNSFETAIHLRPQFIRDRNSFETAIHLRPQFI